jgi:prenyltransferase beta subunit
LEAQLLLGEEPLDADVTAEAVLRLATPSGGFSSSRGQVPDAWSTGYGAISLRLLGRKPPNEALEFIRTLHADGGFSMAPGQPPETWATAFCGIAIADCFGAQPRGDPRVDC